MPALLIRKFVATLATLVAASVVTFTLLEVVPGDPARIMLGINATQDAVDALRERLGLDLPVWERYFAWIGGLVVGDLGTSYAFSQPVADLITERLLVSLPVAFGALLLSTSLAVPVGVFAARHAGRPTDLLITAVTQVGVAVPNFWLAILLVQVFAVSFRLLPGGGFPGWDAGLYPALASLAMPIVSLALPQAAILSRLVRSAMLETMEQDYMRTARAKGAGRTRTLWRHALPNALIPIVTIIGLQFAFLLAGTIIVENVFYLPGLGRLVFQALGQRDLIVVESVVMVLVATIILINFAVDAAYIYLDPRLRTNRVAE